VRRRLAWGLTLPLVFAGSQAAHAVAYMLVYPDAHLRAATLLTTGHRYLAGLPFALALAAAAALVALLCTAIDAARLRPTRDTPAWAFALLAPTTFAFQELLELSCHTGSFGWHAVLAPTFLPGLLLQLPFAVAAYALARLLLRIARSVGRAFARQRVEALVAVTRASKPQQPRLLLVVAAARPRAPPRLAV
jgi:hypothetical protein